MDRIVSNLEAALLPELERLRVQIAQDPRYTGAEVRSLRHADAIHAIGLTCHPVSAANAEDSYCMIVNIIGLSGISMRGIVIWDQPYVLGQLPGYTIYEAMTPSCRLKSDGRLEEFLALLPALFRGFERGLRRGRPPSLLRQWWNKRAFGRT